MTLKQFDPDKQSLYQQHVVTAITMMESRLPLFTCTFVRHTALHFFAPGGWFERIGPAHLLWK
jgi:hypothetical protein